jgi:exonuclease VII large subunit
MMDQGSLERQARAAAAAQYDPVIAALRNQASSASARGERNQRDVISMFNQLGDNLHGDLPAIQQNYDQTQQATGKEYADLQKGIQDQYASSQADQEALYKRLNIEAAAPGILPNQARDKDYFVNRAKTDAQTQQSALTTERQGAIDYTNKGSQMARTEGTQRGADIMSQLTELLNQYNAQIGANEAAKA